MAPTAGKDQNFTVANSSVMNPGADRKMMDSDSDSGGSDGGGRKKY
jgi:hypothetical protein